MSLLAQCLTPSLELGQKRCAKLTPRQNLVIFGLMFFQDFPFDQHTKKMITSLFSLIFPCQLQQCSCFSPLAAHFLFSGISKCQVLRELPSQQKNWVYTWYFAYHIPHLPQLTCSHNVLTLERCVHLMIESSKDMNIHSMTREAA